MEVLSKKLAEQKGEVAVKGVVILLVATILFAAVIQTIHVYHAISEVKEKTNEAVLATASLNVSGIYMGVRESEWFARQYADPSWTANADASQVAYQLANATGGQLMSDNTIFKEESYMISDLISTFDNSSGEGLNFTTTLKLDVFIDIGGIIQTTIPYDLEVHTSYAKKF